MMHPPTRITARVRLPVAATLMATATACSLVTHPAIEPDVTTEPTIVRMQPDREWTDSGLTVHKGERLFFAATGVVRWASRHAESGPDGIDGLVGWRVGTGGLMGRVGERARMFPIGARTSLFPTRAARPPHRLVPPGPIRMDADGELFLGFKDFAPGDNQGAFEVRIRRENMKTRYTAGAMRAPMYCPTCGAEFDDWLVRVCPTCDVDLVDRLGPEPTPDVELVPIRLHGDPGIIPLAKSLLDAEAIEYFVRDEGLPELLGGPAGFTQMRADAEFVVRADDADRARALLDGLTKDAKGTSTP